MYLVAIRSKTKSFNMEDLSNIFPMGFPSHIYLGKMWDKQKIKTGNFVDTVNSSSF